MNDETLFHLALARPAGERSDFLDQACAGDAELRQRLEVLLRSHETPDSFLADCPVEAPPTSVDSDPKSSTVERPERRIGPYKLLQPIGEGGMGTVYMAEQTHPVRRTVALKLIKAGMDSRQVLARFGAERQALALMDHPSIAKVFDAGTSDSGRPYFVMELVKGIPITTYCDERRLTLRERLELAIPVCQAVQHAHQKGIIHRDLKPSNVLIAIYDGKPVPKIIDFGVAKATGQRLTDQTLYTEFGAVVGTLEYMSPEQAELNQLDIDTRSDIYSLGVLLYELLTGSTPLERKRLKKAVFLEILRVIREEESPRPSLRLSTTEELPSIAACRHVEPRKLSGLVQGELDWIVMKALEKDRDRRYETANGLAADLRRYLDDEPVQACPPSAWYRFGKFARRNKAALTAAGLIAMSMLTGVSILAVSNMLITREKNQKEAALIKARDSARAADDQRAIAVANEKTATDRAEDLRRKDYISRVNLAYRECLEDNVARALVLLDDCPEDLRGWEWEYVRRQCHLELRTFHEAAPSVNAVAFSPDGRLIASGSGGYLDDPGLTGDLVVREEATGREVFARKGLPGGLRAVAFSPDSRLIAVGQTWDVVVWELATGRERFRKPEPGKLHALSVAFSPDGRTILVGYGRFYGSGTPGHSRLLDAATGAEEGGKIPGRASGVSDAAFSPDGRQVAQTSKGIVEVWDLGTRTPTLALRGDPDFTNCVAFSPDGRLIATGGHDRNIHLWDRTSGAEVRVLRGHEGFIRAVAFSPNGRRLASVAEDTAVKLWNVSSDRELATFHGHQNYTMSVAFSPDGSRIASGSLDGTTKVWFAAPGDGPAIRLDGYVMGLAFSPDGRRVAASETNHSDRDRLVVQDLTTGERLVSVPAAQVYDLAFSPDGRRLLTRNLAGIQIRDAATGRVEFGLHGPLPMHRGMAIRPSDRVILGACVDGTVRAWDDASGREIPGKRFAIELPRELATVIGTLGVARFNPDGCRLAVVGPGNIVKVYEVDARRELLSLSGHEKPVRVLAFSPDGRWLVTGGGIDLSGAGEIRVWETASGRQVRRLHGHSGVVHALAFSPDGRRLASGGADRVIKLWETDRFGEVLTLKGHASMVYSLVFSPDGRRLASGSEDRTGRIWDLDAPDAASLDGRDVAVRLEQLSARLGREPFELYRQAKWSAAQVAFRQAIEHFDKRAGREPGRSDHRDSAALSRNSLAWLLATCPDSKLRDPTRAADLARKAVELAPREGDYWNTLGVAQYRNGDWKAVIEALTKSMEHRKGGDSSDWFFLAMAYWQLGDKPQARFWHDKAVTGMEKNHSKDEELIRFRAEAAALLGVNEKRD